MPNLTLIVACPLSVWVRYVLHWAHVCKSGKGTLDRARPVQYTVHGAVHFYCPGDGLFCVISLTWAEWWGLGCRTGHHDVLLTCICPSANQRPGMAGGWPMRGENAGDTRRSLTTRWAIKHQDHHRSSCAQPPGLVTSELASPLANQRPSMGWLDQWEASIAHPWYLPHWVNR